MEASIPRTSLRAKLGRCYLEGEAYVLYGELTFYDAVGRPVAYCDDGRHVYEFNGLALAYLEDDSVYAFDGQHLGWWERGWVRDHKGACVFFTDAASGGPPTPARQARPAKGYKNAPPAPAFRHLKPAPIVNSLAWSSRSGLQFFRR